MAYSNFIYFSNSYTIGCPPVREDKPRALASGLSYVQSDNPWYNYYIPPTSVYTLVGKGGIIDSWRKVTNSLKPEFL